MEQLIIVYINSNVNIALPLIWITATAIMKIVGCKT